MAGDFLFTLLHVSVLNPLPGSEMRPELETSRRRGVVKEDRVTHRGKPKSATRGGADLEQTFKHVSVMYLFQAPKRKNRENHRSA